ncbi:MAG: nicotinate (nicotinamide) nucleotide adenylyltransferase [Planctomycetota bacterium]
MHLAIFGGAFDPPHLAHVLAAHYALMQDPVDRVLVLPSADHPYGKQMAPFADRLAMCRLAFADLQRVEVRADEQDNAGGRTIDLLDLLGGRLPGARFSLIGGTDTARDLPNWYRGDELVERISVIAVPRRGHDDEHPAALPPISSTMVRARLATGAAADDLLPRAVAGYCRQHRLYG